GVPPLARLFLNAVVGIPRAVALTKPRPTFRKLAANNGCDCLVARAGWKSRSNASRNFPGTSMRLLQASRKTKGKSAPTTPPELASDRALRQDSHARKRIAIGRKIGGFKLHKRSQL